MDLKNIEIFKTGIHTSSSGQTATYTRADLERIAATYAPAEYEAPNVIGHPAANAPAFGWVERLKVAGDKLLADFTQVPREFVEMVRAGRFKKRSISLFPDGTLRHVGWLGAAAPAVAGLKDVEFKGGEAAHEYEFGDAGADPHNLEDEDMKTVLENLLAAVNGLRTDLAQGKEADQVAGFSRRLGEIETQAKELAAGKEKAEAEAKKAKEDLDKTVKEFGEFKDGQVKKQRERRFEVLVEAGKALPGERDQVLAFAAALAKDGETINFAAPGGQAEQLPKEEAYWRSLEARDPHGLFHDFKAPAGDGGKPATPTNLMSKV